MMLPLALTLNLLLAAPLPIWPVSQVRPGLQGYGLTVFRGTTIERFDVEILGVLPQADADGDWIMFKVTSGTLVERGGGIVAGMSGSPVYVDDKLLGAVAYGPFFPLEPIGFITPIENMLRTLDEPTPRPATVARRVPLPPALRPAFGGAPAVLVGGPAGGESDDTLPVIGPLAAPVMVSGLGAGGVEWVQEAFRPYRLTALQGPGGGQASGRVALEPGAAMGVALAEGDLSATAIGTVTAVIGERVLGFGHPMMQRNEVALPLCSASIVDFIASRQRSSKIGVKLDTVGILDRDGHWAVSGVVGPQRPPLVPVEVTLRAPSRNLTKTVRFAVVDDEQLTPSLVYGLTGGFLSTWLGTTGRVMFDCRTEVRWQGIDQPALRREQGYAAVSPLPAALADLQAALQVTGANPFERLHLRDVRLSLTVTPGEAVATIERARLDRPAVRPGDEVIVDLALRRRDDQRLLLHRLKLPIPADATPGKVKLAIGDARLETALAESLKLPRPVASELPEYLSRFAELDVPETGLVALLALADEDWTVAGRLLPRPPRALAELIALTGASDLQRGPAVVRVSEPLDVVLTNGVQANLVIDGAAPSDKPTQPTVALLTWPEATEPTGPAVLDQPLAALAAGRPMPPGQPPQSPPKPAPKKEEADKLDARTSRIWLQATAKEFGAGELESVSLTAEGHLTLGLGESELADLPTPVVWAADAGERLCLGSGVGEGLTAVGADGRVETLATGGLVTAVATTPAGLVYATAPDGVLRRRTADGQVTVLGTVGSAYVWRILVEGSDLVLACGRPGRVVRFTDGAATTLYGPVDGHLLALAPAPGGGWLASATGPNRLLRLEPDGRAQTIAGCADEVHALLPSPTGDLLWGDGAELKLRRANGAIETLGKVEGEVLDLLAVEGGTLAAVRAKAPPKTGGVWWVGPAAEAPRPVWSSTATAVVRLLPAPTGALAVEALPGRVARLTAPTAATGVFTSTVHDAGGPARFGVLEVAARRPPGARVEVFSRSGFTPQPGDDWTIWTPAGETALTAVGRYFQYRLELTRGEGGAPVVEQVAVHLARFNETPRLALKSPEAGAAWRGKQTLEWQVEDPNGDLPHVTLAAQREGEETWRTLAADVPGAEGKKEIDTSQLPGGIYRFKLVADDGLWNPDDPRTATVVSPPVIVDNQPPELLVTVEQVTDRRAELSVAARDNQRVASVAWRIGEGAWLPGLSIDGVFDQPLEIVRIITGRLPAGETVVQVRAKDAAGGETVRPVTVRVP